MPPVVRYGSNSLFQFLDAPDLVYGTGNDGSLVFDGTTTVLGIVPSSSVYQLNRDIYCYDMTVSASVRVQPNGYRIFVKNLLTLGTSARIGWAPTTGWSTAGSIAQGGDVGVSVTHSLGSNGTGTTATAPTMAMGGPNYYKQPLQAIRGFAITASGGPTLLRGGAGGTGSDKGGGVIICAFRYISSNASFITADGGATAGGGVIIIISTHSSLPANIATSTVGVNANGTVNYIQAL